MLHIFIILSIFEVQSNEASILLFKSSHMLTENQSKVEPFVNEKLKTKPFSCKYDNIFFS
jgi:hypothetical protein